VGPHSYGSAPTPAIAGELVLSVRTAERHITNLLDGGRGAVNRVRDELVGVLIEPAAVASRQKLRIAGDHAQWLLEIV